MTVYIFLPSQQKYIIRPSAPSASRLEAPTVGCGELMASPVPSSLIYKPLI
jgi:hypothetical protein